MKEEETKIQLKKDVEYLKSELPGLLSHIIGEEFDERLNFKLVFREDMYCDRFKQGKNEIHYGLDNKSLGNLKVARKRLVHESIHAAGIHHNNRMRSLNFYSNLSRDLFTSKIMEKIGWEPPTKGEVRKNHRRKGELDYSYVAYCPKCGKRWYRKKRSKVIKHPEKYQCKKCEVKLKSREISEEEKMEFYQNS